MDFNGDGGSDDGGNGDAGSVNDLLGGGNGQPAGDSGDGGDGGSGSGDGQPAGDGGDGGGQADPDWYSSLSAAVEDGQTASNLDLVKSKGWKSLDDVVKSYREAERAVRDGGRVKVPGEGASPEEVAAYHKAIGVPEKPDGYATPEIKDADGNPVEINTALTDRVKAAAHKAGVPKEALDAILAEEVQAQAAEYDQIVKQLQAKSAEHVKSWGEDRENKLAQINAAAKDLGLSRADMDYLRGMPSGPGKALDMLAKFGTNFTEDSLIGGEKRSFGMNADQAQAEIAAIRGDKAVLDKAMVPGTPENGRYNRALEALGAAADKAAAAA